MSKAPSADVVICRAVPTGRGGMIDLYAQAGRNFRSYADEEYIGDVPRSYLATRGLDGGRRGSTDHFTVELPLATFKAIKRRSSHGWG